MTTATAPIPKQDTHEEGDFVVYSDVPVFKEHSRRIRFGDELRSIKFSAQDMERICEKNNERIAETNDFVPIILNHTREDGSIEPEVVGFAGPFRTGQIGKKNPVTGILARMRFFKQDAERVKKFPRVSVEYWHSASDPSGGFLDPIALLGATTPELDLGIRYQRQDDTSGLQCARYQRTLYEMAASAPSGGNAFVPGCTTQKKKYEAETMPMSPEDIQQVVAGVKDYVDSAIQQLKHELLSAIEEEGADSEEAAEGVVPPGGEGEAAQYSGEPAPAVTKKPQTPAGELPQPGITETKPGLPEGGADGTEGGSGAAPEKGKKTNYEAVVAERDNYKEKYEKLYQTYRSTTAGEGEVVPTAPAEDTTMLRQQYARVARENRDLLAAKAEADAKALEAEERALVAERYQAIRECEAEGFCVDADEEIVHCGPQQMNPGQFTAHIERIRTRYARIPMGRSMPTEKPKVLSPAEDEMTTRQRYAKEASALVLAEREKNPATTMTWDEAYKTVKSHNGQGQALGVVG